MSNYSISFAPEVAESSIANIDPPLYLMNELSRVMVIRSIYWATKHGIAELLQEGPQTIATLAERTETHPRALYRLLRALDGIGIFQEINDENQNDYTQIRFIQTPTSLYLLPETPRTLYPLIMMWQSDFQWNAWGSVDYSLKTNKPALEERYGVNMYEYLAQHPEEQEIFNRAMTSIGTGVNQPIVDAYKQEFATAKKLVEVGAGRGSFLATVLKAHPHLQVVHFDRPVVVEEVAQTEEVARHPNVKLQGGNFFEAVPEGGDVYFLKQVILNWSDDESVQILTNCRKALAPGGRVLVAEQVLHPGPGKDTWGKFLDLQMLVTLRGGNRTEAEYHELFRRAGLKITRIIPTNSFYSIVEGEQAE